MLFSKKKSSSFQVQKTEYHGEKHKVQVAMKIIPVVLMSIILNVSSLFSDPSTQDIYSHILIKDYTSACEKSRLFLQQYPDHKALWEAYIKALAKAGEEKEMCRAWQQYIKLFPSEANNRDMIEAMAWGVIEKGDRSSSLVIRAAALVASFLTQDAKGVNIIHRNLQGNNSVLRGIAVQLASNMRDAKLMDEVLRLFYEEKVWAVRLEAIQGVGKMKITSATPYLEAIVANDKSMAEEKAAALQSLVYLLEDIDRQKIVKLVESDRAGLRLIACKAVAHLNLKQDGQLLIPLIHDPHPEVRVEALYTLGTLRVNNIDIMSLAEQHLDDPDPMVVITAAWYLTVHQSQAGQKAFHNLLAHESKAFEQEQLG